MKADVGRDEQVPAMIPRQVLIQKAKARVLAVKTALDGYTDVSGLDLDQAARHMAADPIAFIRSLNHVSTESRVVVFDVTKDLARQVILYLAPFETLHLHTTFTRKKIAADPGLTLLGTTKAGGMMRAPGDWGQLHSRYDGLLGANLNPAMPEDRRMVLARCRIWAIFQG
ncbi:MAG: transmembrane fusion protein, partial [Desulfotignum sp.]